MMASNLKQIEKGLARTFKKYIIDFEAFDLNGVSESYCLPCQLTTAKKVVVLTDEGIFKQEFKQMFDALQSSGFTHTHYDQISYALLNDNQVIVSVNWYFLNAQEIEIARFSTIYSLQLIGNEYRIFNAISHDIGNKINFPNKLQSF